jgi:hypothetical protein
MMKKILLMPNVIKVTLAPISDSNTPDFVKQAFVGESFHYLEKVPSTDQMKQVRFYCYKVNKLEAVMILQNKSPEAARWIDDHPEVFPGPFLYLNEESCIPEETFCPQAFRSYEAPEIIPQPTHVLCGEKRVIH